MVCKQLACRWCADEAGLMIFLQQEAGSSLGLAALFVALMEK